MKSRPMDKCSYLSNTLPALVMCLHYENITVAKRKTSRSFRAEHEQLLTVIQLLIVNYFYWNILLNGWFEILETYFYIIRYLYGEIETTKKQNNSKKYYPLGSFKSEPEINAVKENNIERITITTLPRFRKVKHSLNSTRPSL